MPTVIEGIKFYTVQEAAEVLKVTAQTVRKYIKSGRLKGIRIGKGDLITEKDIKKFLEK